MVDDNIYTKQIILSPAAGKRIIAKALLKHPSITEALELRTVVIIAGTTNGYVAEELLNKIGQAEEFTKDRFFRGVTLPQTYKKTDTGRLSDESKFPGDIVIEKGKWLSGKTIFDVVDNLKKGDIIIKGANAVNLEQKLAAVYIGHPTAGTIGVALQAILGKRVELFLPVGLEKRISGDINRIAQKINSPNTTGLRYMPINGEIITELEAIKLLTGAESELVAGGGICGAEGSCWLAVSGNLEQLNNVSSLVEEISNEPSFVI